MTHEKYNELQKKMDKLVSEFVDEMADIETEEDIETVSAWLDEKMDEMFNWVNTDDKKVLAELRADYIKIKEMLLC
uniref:Flavinator of succinate dehydrogenase n=1 Tax=Siphoviridae sp. ctu8P6 TaxID=2827282 RepID=A0A8S5R457_9CAUD|nr:MAG TPA: Flavinator of succinate dehydrogenase [Siphoviridae sp. ctu8P6]